MPDIEEKVALIEDVLGFDLDESILESAQIFPSPEGFIGSKYRTAKIFRNVRGSRGGGGRTL